ncbi:MAG: phosphatase PAP2 family protein [Alphaproteobacteria bacterium]|nr:phosphatase PAP2 family protein [Alphaproteobacteria bacterium]
MNKLVQLCYDEIKKICRKAFDYHKLQPLIFPALFVLFLLLASLEEIVDDVMEGDTHALDQYVLMLFRDPQNINDTVGPHWVAEMMRDFSALGGFTVLTMVTIAVAVYFFVAKKAGKAWYMLMAVGTGTLLTNILKAGFDRPRPNLSLLDTYTYTSSFPSGHSMMAAVVYLTLGGLLAQSQQQKRMKFYIFGMALVTAFLVGISRVFLGAHWVSDVAAGWMAGLAWALLFWLGQRYWVARRYNAQ